MNNPLKTGFATSEFYLTLAMGIVAAFKQHIAPDLPDEAINLVLAYIFARMVPKAISVFRQGTPEKPGAVTGGNAIVKS